MKLSSERVKLVCANPECPPIAVTAISHIMLHMLQIRCGQCDGIITVISQADLESL